MESIKAHGGRLVDRTSSINPEDLRGLERVDLDIRSMLDAELIGNGAYSPLEGFMTQADYENVVEKMRLSNYVPWTLPITLAVQEDEAARLKEGDDVALVHRNGSADFLALLHLEEKYRYDKNKEGEMVYRTLDPSHPGVADLLAQGDVFLGGKIDIVKNQGHEGFHEHRYTPSETRRIFSEKGWRTIVGFQTRNPIHRAHEYITKCALEMVDGLFIHPLVGATKKGDISSITRMKCYKCILDHYYPSERTLLGIFPAAMRYAGPREAVFHAIVRKNYGCTHFTVGRDHAGVGGFYGTYDAQNIFQEFEPCEIGIVPLFFEHVFYCQSCGHMASYKTCPHSADERISLSGTRVRELLSMEQAPPPEFTRPEVAKILIDENGLKQPMKIEGAEEKR